MSAAEDKAWQTPRTLRAEGIHLVRQHKIGRYIVDFASRRQRLAIEIDGGVHELPGRAEYDAKRQQQLEGIGWRFIRIRAENVHDDLTLLNTVRAALTPSPSMGGGRGRGEPPSNEDEAQISPSENTNDGGSPRPLTPSPQGDGERLTFEKKLQRRTRANRVLPSRAKS